MATIVSFLTSRAPMKAPAKAATVATPTASQSTFFGVLVALNLHTSFLSPPVAMAPFYLKGVAPPHVTLNQIFLGMIPFMGIQILAIVLLYIWPAIGMWLPQTLYK